MRRGVKREGLGWLLSVAGGTRRGMRVLAGLGRVLEGSGRAAGGSWMVEGGRREGLGRVGEGCRRV